MSKPETKSGIAIYSLCTARFFVAKLAISLLVILCFLLVVAFAMQAVFLQAHPLDATGCTLLLVAVLILLFVVLVLQIVLLWCSCGNAGRLQENLKLLPSVGASLNATVEALFLMENALRGAQIPVRSVGGALSEAGDKLDIAIVKLTPNVTHFDILNADVVTGLSATEWKPFGEAKTSLKTAGGKLKDDPDSLDAKLGETADQCHIAALSLRVIAQAFEQN